MQLLLLLTRVIQNSRFKRWEEEIPLLSKAIFRFPYSSKSCSYRLCRQGLHIANVFCMNYYYLCEKNMQTGAAFFQCCIMLCMFYYVSGLHTCFICNMIIKFSLPSSFARIHFLREGILLCPP